ncbi:DNA-deoxyinosine glycosylase [Methylophaga sp. OBS3]|uniref:DNA-deoxyinosine glycosylase n=1 Tax=Methylophaga sp. OBS3 TaxID=2991934 RepID=UPI002257F0D3|nr:DNA-deoxyinosine glycosylase [Methylophaga sp. OBS3]MCX4190378.1 DNA-deoxyinosine glycosylase [Methylophaga sp. OBS3]
MSVPLAHSFDWLAKSDAKLLIVGSMPGIASLQQQQYYAHPRNAFWPIMQHIFGWSEMTYTERCQALVNEKIALWDVLRHCRRRGSLDSAIERDTIAINDFDALFKFAPNITTVCTNGGKANQLFKRHVQLAKHISIKVLPSTSPAYAAMSFDNKLAHWHSIITKSLS